MKKWLLHICAAAFFMSAELTEYKGDFVQNRGGIEG
jgi:hypothetical protein